MDDVSSPDNCESPRPKDREAGAGEKEDDGSDEPLTQQEIDDDVERTIEYERVKSLVENSPRISHTEP